MRTSSFSGVKNYRGSTPRGGYFVNELAGACKRKKWLKMDFAVGYF